MKNTSSGLVAFTLLGSVGAITVLNPTKAAAGGFSTARFGGEHGNAASDSVTSLYYNPAGIAMADEGTHVYVEGLFAYRTVNYNRDGDAIDNPNTGTPQDAKDSNRGKAHLANPIVSPFLGVSSDLGQKGLAVGLAFYAPFGGQAKWDRNAEYEDSEYPGAVFGQQRWAVIEGAQRSLYFTAGGAYATKDKKLSFGVGVNLVLTDIALDRARNALGTDDVVSEGNALLEVKGTDLGVGIGVMWRPTPELRVGVGYQSRPGFGQQELEGKLSTKFGSAAPLEQDVVLIQTMPDTARIAAELDATETLIVRGQFEWQNWSVFDKQCLVPKEDPSRRCAFNPDGSIDDDDPGAAQGTLVNLPRNWNDGWNIKAGVAWHDAKGMEIGGSILYDANVVPDETMDPSLFDMNKVLIQGGIVYPVNDKVTIHGTLAEVYYMKRTVAPRTVDPMAPSRNPDMAGKYQTNVVYGILGVGVNF